MQAVYKVTITPEEYLELEREAEEKSEYYYYNARLVERAASLASLDLRCDK